MGTWTWHKEVGGKSAGEIGGWRKSDWVIDKAKEPIEPLGTTSPFFLSTNSTWHSEMETLASCDE